MSVDKKVDWLEKLTKSLFLYVGALGVLVIYSGFFYLLLIGQNDALLPWYILLSPWVCIFYGLKQQQQKAVIHWFIGKGRNNDV